LPTVPSSFRAVGAVLCTVAIVVATLLATSSLERGAANRGYEGALTAQALLNTMLDRDTGLRGFLETDDVAFLEPYASGSRSFPGAVRDAQAYTSGLTSATSALDEQVALAAHWQVLAQAAIAQAHNGGVAHQSLRAALTRKRVLDAFRAANTRYLAAMNARRLQLLADATTWTTWIVVGLSLLLTLTGLWRVRVNTARERRAQRALRTVEQERDAREREGIEARWRLAEISAHTDALTELPNRRALDETFRQMLAQAAREQTPLSTVLIDLDRFKDVNDTYGHDHGDEVLRVVARTLKESIRGSDFAARLGGEEFLVLLPNTDLMGAMVVAEGIARSLSTASVHGMERMVTASFGVAGYPMHGMDAQALLRSADRAMYQAKSDGRDCVRMASAAPAIRDGAVFVPAGAAEPV
jgi:diguanylate cyclase (GGDEF)-like protein